MEKILLDIDISLFGMKPTKYGYLYKIIEEIETGIITANYVFINSSGLPEYDTYYYDKTKRVENLLEDQKRSTYDYLLSINKPEVIDKIETQMDDLQNLLVQRVKMLGITSLSLIATPVIAYALQHFQDNPKFYTFLILFGVKQLIDGGKNLSVIQKLKDEYNQLTDKIDYLYISEGDKLVKRERKL